MRVTFVLPNPSLNGGTRVVAIHAQNLCRMGHDVKIVASPAGRRSWRANAKSWLKGQGWASDRRSVSHLDGRGLDCVILDEARPVTDTDVPDADVVIATWWETAEWVNALGPSKGAKAYFIQGHEVFDFLPQQRTRASYSFPMHKITVSRWLQRLMHREYGDDAADLVPNSVDHEQFFAGPRNKQSTPTIGLLYSATRLKGVDVSLEVLERINKIWPDLKIMSFGDKPQKNPVRLPRNADYHCQPPQNGIRDIYSACDVWLTASRSEGFNLPAMEAMACGTPVVSTRTGWPEEAIRSQFNGDLADVDDIDGLTRGAKWILSLSNANWRELSNNARDTVANSSWENSTALFERSLHRAIERARSGQIAGGTS